MVIIGVDRATCQTIAEKHEMTLYTKSSVQNQDSFMLRPTGDKFRAYTEPRVQGQKRRKKHAITWEGHEVFMREVFAINPDAVIKTCKVTYKGLADFETKYKGTYYGGQYGAL